MVRPSPVKALSGFHLQQRHRPALFSADNVASGYVLTFRCKLATQIQNCWYDIAASRSMPSSEARMPATREFDYVIVGAGSAGCGAGRPVEFRSCRYRAPARSRRLGLASLDTHSARGWAHLGLRPLRLGLRDRTRAEHRRPPDRDRARQDRRRLEFHQRHGLHPRPSRRLRPLGVLWPARLVLPRTSALLQTGRGPGRMAKRPIAAATA